VVVDSSSIRALHGGRKTGRNPTDRGRKGSKHHIATDANGIPLASSLNGANERDVTQIIPLVDAIPAVRGKPGRPRRRPERVQGDRAYDAKHHRAMLREWGIEPVTARRNAEHGSGLGKTLWVVQRTVSWLHQMRRLRLRVERRADIHEAFMALGCAIVTSFFL
jgi:transposase